jgi:hypothetical protein
MSSAVGCSRASYSIERASFTAKADRKIARRSSSSRVVRSRSIPSTRRRVFVARLLLEVPAEMPVALVDEIHQAEIQSARERSRHAVGPFLAFFVVMGPLVFLLPVASWPLVIALGLVIGGVLTTSIINWRVRHVAPWIHVSLQLLAAVLFSQVSGPLVLTPCLVVSMMFAVASMPGFGDRSWLVMMWTAAAALIPLVLEGIGVFASSWRVSDEGLVTHGTIFESTRSGNLLVVGMNVVVVLLVAGSFGVTRDRRGPSAAATTGAALAPAVAQARITKITFRCCRAPSRRRRSATASAASPTDRRACRFACGPRAV